MGRTTVIEDGDVLAVTGEQTSSRLKVNGDRRAIVDAIIDKGGRARLAEINEALGWDVRPRAMALINAQWLKLIKEKDVKDLPTRWKSEEL